MIPPITITELQALNEARVVSIGKDITFIPDSIRPEVIRGISKEMHISEEQASNYITSEFRYGEISTQFKNILDATVKHHLEQYNVEEDLMLLESENIVEAYNALIASRLEDVEKISKKLTEIKQTVPLKYQEYQAEREKLSVCMSKVIDQYSILCRAVGTDEAKKIVINEWYEPSEDPKVIREIIKLRVNYNNTMIQLFQAMIKNNYRELGYSEQEAKFYVEQLSKDSTPENQRDTIKDIKAKLFENQKKYDNGRFIDLRKLGAGVVYVTKEGGGLERFTSVDKLIQISMRWDCIILGHGGSEVNPGTEEYRRLKEYEKRLDDLNTELKTKREEANKFYKDHFIKIDYNTIHEENPEFKAIQKRFEKLRRIEDKAFKRCSRLKHMSTVAFRQYQDNKITKEEYDKYEEAYEKALNLSNKLNDLLRNGYDELSTVRHNNITNYKDKTSKIYNKMVENIKPIQAEFDNLDAECRAFKAAIPKEMHHWDIQPIYTEKAGPFTDMNELVRQCIKEGKKSIYIMSCNPGHHELAQDIKDAKGVRIAHGRNILLVETTSSFADYDHDIDLQIALDEMAQAEYAIMQECTQMGIRYGDDTDLEEAYNDVCNMNGSYWAMNESASSIWAKLKEYALKAVKAIVWLFKKIVEIVKKALSKIKGFFTSRFGSGKKLKRKIRLRIAFTEAASMKSADVDSLDAAEAFVAKSAQVMLSKISELERKQVELSNRMAQFVDKAAAKNETAISLHTLRSI